MEINKGVVKFLGRDFECRVTFPEPKRPMTEWLNKHGIFLKLRGDVSTYKDRNLTDVLLKLTSGKEVRYNCCSVATLGFMPPKEKTDISVHKEYLWGGRRIKKYRADEWEAYNYVPCSLSTALIKYHLDCIGIFLKDIFYWDTLFAYTVIPFCKLIFNSKRANFRWNKVNNFVIQEMIKLREHSYLTWREHNKDFAELVHNKYRINELYERLAILANGEVKEVERKPTIKAMLALDNLDEVERRILNKKIDNLRLAYGT